VQQQEGRRRREVVECIRGGLDQGAFRVVLRFERAKCAIRDKAPATAILMVYSGDFSKLGCVQFTTHHTTGVRFPCPLPQPAEYLDVRDPLRAMAENYGISEERDPSLHS
jgi:hypothetical protein